MPRNYEPMPAAVSKLIWMPFCPRDYLADTMHLVTEEHGAYFLLICHYWVHEGLPQDPAALAAITKLTLKRWLAMAPTMAKFFEADWKHKRIEKELAKARHKSQVRRDAANKRYRKNPANADAIAYGGGAAIAPKNNANARVRKLQNASHLEQDNLPIGIEIIDEKSPKPMQMDPNLHTQAQKKERESEKKEAVVLNLVRAREPQATHPDDIDCQADKTKPLKTDDELGGLKLQPIWAFLEKRIIAIAHETKALEPLGIPAALLEMKAKGVDPDEARSVIEGELYERLPDYRVRAYKASWLTEKVMEHHSRNEAAVARGAAPRGAKLNGSAALGPKTPPLKIGPDGKEYYANAEQLYEHVRLEPEKILPEQWIALGERFKNIDGAWLWQWPCPGMHGCPMPAELQPKYKR